MSRKCLIAVLCKSNANRGSLRKLVTSKEFEQILDRRVVQMAHECTVYALGSPRNDSCCCLYLVASFLDTIGHIYI